MIKKEPINIHKHPEDAVIPNMDEVEKDPMYLEIISLLTTFFNDEEKAIDWMYVENPMLGGVSPIEMMVHGRGEKLLKWIKTSLDENERKET